jgi:hypothetical protein
MSAPDDTTGDALAPDLENGEEAAEFEQGASISDGDPDDVDDARAPEPEDDLTPEQRTQAAQHIDAILNNHRNSVRGNFDSGSRLNELKKIKDGRFLAKIADKFPFSIRSGQRMMSAAEAFEGQYDTVSHLPIYQNAIYLLSARGVPQSARDEAIKLAKSGARITKEKAKWLVAKHKNAAGGGDHSTSRTKGAKGSTSDKPSPKPGGTAWTKAQRDGMEELYLWNQSEFLGRVLPEEEKLGLRRDTMIKHIALFLSGYGDDNPDGRKLLFEAVDELRSQAAQ